MSRMPAGNSMKSASTPNRIAADAAIPDQITGTMTSIKGGASAATSRPAVRMAVGQGTPNVGTLGYSTSTLFGATLFPRAFA
jgi:hypothetical protein